MLYSVHLRLLVPNAVLWITTDNGKPKVVSSSVITPSHNVLRVITHTLLCDFPALEKLSEITNGAPVWEHSPHLVMFQLLDSYIYSPPNFISLERTLKVISSTDVIWTFAKHDFVKSFSLINITASHIQHASYTHYIFKLKQNFPFIVFPNLFLYWTTELDGHPSHLRTIHCYAHHTGHQ